MIFTKMNYFGNLISKQGRMLVSDYRSYKERTVPRHALKSVGAAARRRVLANIQAAFHKMSCTERLPEKIINPNYPK